MQDYGAAAGGVGASATEIADLHKALSAGNDINNPGTAAGEGFPLRTESLEATLKNLTYEMDEIKLFKSIPKVPASNTVEEFNRLVSYGEGGARSFNQGFFSEGGLPDEQDSTYERVTVLIKFLGITGRVTHVANTIRAAHGNVIALETMNKTMELLRNLENALFFGDSDLIPEQWDGLYKLIEDGAPDNVIDLRGGVLTEDALNDMLLTIRDNYGQATDAYFGTGPYADLAKQVYDRQRFAYAPAPGTLGTTITAFQGQHGKINLHDHVFITPGQAARSAALGRADRRPGTPTITVAPAAGASASSQFGTSDLIPIYDNGKYGMTEGGIYILVESENEGQRLVEYLKSSIIQFVIKATKWSNFETNYQIFHYLPNTPNIKIINDNALFKYFELSNDDIKLIKTNI